MFLPTFRDSDSFCHAICNLFISKWGLYHHNMLCLDLHKHSHRLVMCKYSVEVGC